MAILSAVGRWYRAKLADQPEVMVRRFGLGGNRTVIFR